MTDWNPAEILESNQIHFQFQFIKSYQLIIFGLGVEQNVDIPCW